MKRAGRILGAGACAAAAWLLCPAGLGAQEEELPVVPPADAAAVASAQSACGNEIGLFCRGESGAALLDCLTAYRGSATARCSAALAASDPAAPAARVWGSQIAAQTGTPPKPKFFGAKSGAGGPGFDFAVSEATETTSTGGAGSAPPSVKLGFNYTSDSRGGTCSVASAHVRLEIARMGDRSDGRKQNSVLAAQEFLRRLQTLSGLPSCADLDAAVQALYRREQQDARQPSAAMR